MTSTNTGEKSVNYSIPFSQLWIGTATIKFSALVF